jgi:hypothetical protein
MIGLEGGEGLGSLNPGSSHPVLAAGPYYQVLMLISVTVSNLRLYRRKASLTQSCILPHV